MKRATHKVVSVTVIPNAKPLTETVEGPLPVGKARALCDKLNDAAVMADLNPDRITTYMVAPA